MAVETLDTILRRRATGALGIWNGWEAKLKPGSFTKGHRGQYGDFVGFVKAANPEQYAAAQAELAAINEQRDTPTELPNEDSPDIEDQVNTVVERYVGDGTVMKPRRKRSSTILTGLNNDAAAAPRVKRKSLLGSYSANG